MKPIETTIVLNNRWGYCYLPQTFPSKNQALKYTREMIKNGYAWACQIIKLK